MSWHGYPSNANLTFNTTLSQRLYNDCIQKHNRITMFQLAVQITTIVFGTLMLCLVQCKSIANWLNSQCFYNILVKYTIIVICNFFPVLLAEDGKKMAGLALTTLA